MDRINLVELAKRCGLHKFRCPDCGKEQSAMVAIRQLFNLILTEVGKGKKVNISSFGVFFLTSWKAPKSKITRRCERIYRLTFKASKKAKKKYLQQVKEG